jgi:hypothetical protein
MDMRENMFRFFAFALIFGLCSISVFAQQSELKSTDYVSAKNVSCQQKAGQLSQLNQIAQLKYDPFKTPNLARTNNGLPLFAFAMPQSLLAFQIAPMDQMMDGAPGRGRKIDWACVAVCVAITGNVLTCADLCVMN